MNPDQLLLGKINAAVAAAAEAERKVETAQTELVSRSKIVGGLLLEAKKRHPTVSGFERFLERVDGLKLSRAYDYLRLAGGRVTDEELREDARERKRKSREKQKKELPKPLPAPKPISVTHSNVTESSEIDPKQHRADSARLDEDAKASADYLADFKTACRELLPKITDAADRMAAVAHFQTVLKRVREEEKIKRRVA